MSVAIIVIVVVIAAFVVITALQSFHTIGPTEVGLVQKRFSFKKLPDDNPIAFHGEAGYQAELLTPGLRFKLWPVFGVKKFPWVQVPAGEIGVVIAQVGAPLPIGAKSANYKPEFANFSSLERFISGGGQKGVQRPVLTPGTLLPIHPVAFLVVTSRKVYGLPVSPDRVRAGENRDSGGAEAITRSASRPSSSRSWSYSATSPQDMSGDPSRQLEGPPLPSSNIAETGSRRTAATSRAWSRVSRRCRTPRSSRS